MKKQFLIKSYAKLSDAKLDVKAHVIIASLTDNPNFSVTIPTLADFTAAATLFAERLNTAAGRDRVAVILKNEARQNLLNLMRLLATNIESLSDENLSKMASSGFTLSAAGGNSAPIHAPRDFQLQDGKNSGEMRFSVKKVAYAKSYMFQHTVGPLTSEIQWISRGSSFKEYTFKNLPVGERLFCRVAVIGPRGQEVFSATQSRIVQ